ncbi:MAG: VirB4 family type IV secretion system protein [Candidatus Limnocylindrales bacterium]
MPTLNRPVIAGLELAPVSIELMADVEREAALDALAELYDAVGRPFQLLSVPADRDPSEHLDLMAARVEGRRVGRAFDAYAALYRELAAAPRRRLRRTYLLVGSAPGAEAERVRDALARSALEAGVDAVPVGPDEVAGLTVGIAGTAPLLVEPSVVTGDHLLCALVPSPRWPAQVEPGWLARLLAVEGVGPVSMRVRPLGRAEAMALMTTRLRQVRAADRLAAERGEIADVERERVGETATAARRSVQAGRGRVYLVDTVLLVEASGPAGLAGRLETLRLEGRATGLELDAATFRQAAALRSVLPGPAPRPLAERNLDSGSLAASLLHVASDLYEPSGHLYGRSRTGGEPIVLDRFAHASHNAIVLGQTGTGKTMLTGAEMGRCLVRGVRVLAVDPLGDYRRLAAELGGAYLELGSPGVALNPFAFTGAATDGALTAKIASLTRLVAAMAGGLTRDERPPLDRALRAVYEDAGIGPDPASLGREPPALGGLVDRLGGTADGVALARRLERWATGSLGHLFAGGAALPLDRRLVVVGLAALSDPEVRAVAQLAALGLLWDAVRRDLAPKLVVVDEAWKVMRQPAGAEFVEELARSARHYGAGLQLATQDIVEFLRSDFGESIVKQSDIRVLLGQTPEGADALTRYFDLTPAERRSLVHARPGEGLLFVGRSHVAFEAVVSRREYAALTTRPSDLLAAGAGRAGGG